MRHALVDLKAKTVKTVYPPGDGLVKVPDADGQNFTWRERDFADESRAILPIVPAEVPRDEILVKRLDPVFDGEKVVEQVETAPKPEPESEPTDQERLESAIGLTLKQIKAVLGIA